ncbi:glycosyltransferase [Synechococcales cyanobacterium C]|uniref:Glycosyltransferase n=1 Tax=Petrachloros mirabilis ULC683 TaxID=2781853 RepID=A0A8K2A1D6_9CYAN|nr:glycosyltransferase [Petrachloros mirabilis]NCJ07642.1 glycosyltransferase [Petrachloros mirabilis ULC683]
MKILLVIPSLGSIDGGTTNTVISLAESLGSQGINVDVVTTNANGLALVDVPLYTWLNKSGYRVRYFSYSNLGTYKWSISFANWLFNHVSDYDIVHIHAIFSLPNIPAYFACQFKQIPYVVTPHGMLEPWALSYKAWKKKLYYFIFERPALKKASFIQAISSLEAEHIHLLNLDVNVALVANGVHLDHYENLPDSKIFFEQFPKILSKTLILFLGRIDPKKGLDLLSEAFKDINCQFPNTHLVIAGPDAIGFQPKVEGFFAQYGCLESVTFTGMLTGKLKYAALSASDLYVAPSYSEGFSISILEAMASSLPCIITTGCNFPEALESHSAYIVEPNASQIGDALRRCLQNSEAAREMGMRAHELVCKYYTWDKVATQLIDVYTSILNK